MVWSTRGYAMSQTSFVELLIGNGIGRNASWRRSRNCLIGRVFRHWWSGSPRRHRASALSALAMFKALLLQQWYGLSDRDLRRPCSIGFRSDGFAAYRWRGQRRRDHLCRFRNDLKASGLGEPLFAEVSRQFEAAGLTLRSGTLIDATLVESAVRSPAPGTTAKGEESRSPHDGDANWTRQGQSRRLFFGYKVHVGVDLGSGLIRSRLVTQPRPMRARLPISSSSAMRRPSMPTRPMRRRPGGQH